MGHLKFRYEDYVGRRFHSLEILNFFPDIRIKPNTGPVFLCRCDCGVEKQVVALKVCNGTTKSCGCLARKNHVTGGKVKHGHALHGVPSRLYMVWSHMKSRCLNRNEPAYHRYGGRGIRICDRWLGENGFLNFAHDMGPRPKGTSIDRINNDGHYEPENCRWATAREQANNRRSSTCVTIGSETRTVAEWARVSGIRPSLIANRLSRGENGEMLLRSPNGRIKPRLVLDTLTAFGRTQTYIEWSNETGISYGAIRARIRLGWAPEEAVSKPAIERRHDQWGTI